jgi:hypothetical protein
MYRVGTGWDSFMLQRLTHTACPNSRFTGFYSRHFFELLSSAHFTSPNHCVLSKVVFHWIVSVSQDTRYMDRYAACTLFMPCLLRGNDQNSILSCVAVVVLCTVGAPTVAAHGMRACDSSEL